jgi:hypothetical protein
VLDVESGQFSPFDAGLQQAGDRNDPLAGVDLLQ